MACDADQLLEDAKCYLCLIPAGYMDAVELVLLCALRDGETLDCDPQSLINEANCIWCKLGAIPGAMQAAKIAVMCDILAGL